MNYYQNKNIYELVPALQQVHIKTHQVLPAQVLVIKINHQNAIKKGQGYRSTWQNKICIVSPVKGVMHSTD